MDISPWDLECILCDEMAEPQALLLSLLKKITHDFSDEQEIGRGGFSVVYKGMLGNRTVAVKRKSNTYMYEKEFHQELECLMIVKHKNIVRFLGYCADTQGKMEKYDGKFVMADVQERLLCFEYLPKGSLDKYITDTSVGLRWRDRYKIITGICQGLHYLHLINIVHLNLKPTNILVDDNWVPKLSDFYISRCFDQMESRFITKIVGTPGYLAPEAFSNTEITYGESYRLDIYSLGVVIMQILTGKKGFQDVDNVVGKWSCMLEKSQRDIQLKQVRVCAEIGIECTNFNPVNRPDTQHIINRLNEIGTMDGYIGTAVMTSKQVKYDPHELHKHTNNAPGEASSEVEGGSGISMGLANMKMDASSDRVDKQSALSVLEQIILDQSVEPTNVPLALLQHITEDFADKQQIGKGGFGVVYKGHLQNGNVAVKRLFNAHTIDEGLFYHEATCLISVKHKNVVRLLGYCANTETKVVPNPNPKETMKFVLAEIRERLLCFEYIKNGSLDNYLTDELRGLEWHMRYEIIKGICNGLDYLHNEKGIIHRDLKPANILVDDLMLPKITDFGISKLLNGATHAVTSNVAISIGYSAPEFIHRGMVSSKSDIYSLGSIIMELVTGRKGDPDIKNVLRKWRHRWNKSVKYPLFGYQQVTKCIKIASRCLSDSPNERPYAKDILSMLDAIESTDVQINGTGESPVGLISPYPWELLEFDKLELNFPFEINKQIPCSMELTNITGDHTAFDIKKKGMLEYCIEPNKGVVPARSKCIVTVTLLSRETAPYSTMCEDELVVRSTAVNEVLTTEDIHDDMFNKSGRFVDVATLAVVIQGMVITR